ncbi:DUF4350 domain-containing protein [Uliginosibacterium gangwonense]|uniref:DUF4350 domain-containing protein n=1 Tax=Uliginosibacterium gangwonense TaxID=392736 RepID=UPI000369E4D6|nr:DUF4350 domain-containing protein [Uliginosibacterium gangwonense]
MSKTRWILLTIALILVSLVGSFLAMHLRWEQTTRRTGMTGEALHNPYHAGMELMDRLGYPAKRLDNTASLARLSSQTTLLLADPGKFSDKTQLAILTNWVRNGGHLVLPLSTEQRDNPLFDAFGIQPLGAMQDKESKTFKLHVEGETLQIRLDEAEVFESDKAPMWEADLDGWFVSDVAKHPKPSEDEDEDSEGNNASLKHKEHFVTVQPKDVDDPEPTDTVSIYARLKYGKGFVTVGDTSMLTNPQIAKFDHGRLLVHLLSLPDDNRPVFMILAPEFPSLPAWLAQHAPEALAAFLLLALSSIWHFAPRFGPLLPEPQPVRPGLREHLSASGSFLLKARAYEALIAPLREEVTRQLSFLQSRHPEIRTPHDLGAALSGMNANEIARALMPDPENHQEFLRRCHTLAVLRDHCNRMRQPASDPGTHP